MTGKIISAILVVVGLVNFGPIVGLVSAQRLQGLYGIGFEEPSLLILMRHRALLLGLVGAFIIYSAFRPSLQPLAFGAGFVSMMSFIGLAWQIGGYNASIQKVVAIDAVATVALAVAMVLYLAKKP